MDVLATAHFKPEEFWTGFATATRLGIDNRVPPELKPNLQRLMQAAERIRSIHGQPMSVKGYRCLLLNTAVGGAKESYHMLALAIDFDPPPGVTHDQLQHEIAALPDFDFDLIMEESAKDGAHWLHFQLPKPGMKGRRLVRDASLDHQGGAISRTTQG